MINGDYMPLRPQTTIAIEKVNTVSNPAQPSERISIAVYKAVRKNFRPYDILICAISGESENVNDTANQETLQRIESLKAGLLSALGMLLAFGIVTLGNQWVFAQQFSEFTTQGLLSREWSLLVSGAIAFFSGFLFGITYRYVIREDCNSHLKSGAVLAFALVRSLGQVDLGLNGSLDLPILAAIALESLVLFAAARITLDWAIERQWVKAFPAKGF